MLPGVSHENKVMTQWGSTDVQQFKRMCFRFHATMTEEFDGVPTQTVLTAKKARCAPVGRGEFQRNERWDSARGM